MQTKRSPRILNDDQLFDMSYVIMPMVFCRIRQAAGNQQMKLECRHITKIFGEGSKATRALEDISFETQEGEFLCILGPSGCGKSTLLRIIAGLLEPTGGDVIYSGNTMAGPLNSMVFQEHGVFPWMNVIDNVAFGLEMQGISRKERYERSLDFLKRVGLSQVCTAESA